jgi:hypothetical protein
VLVDRHVTRHYVITYDHHMPDRIDDLERRVSALETRLATSDPPAVGTSEEDTFWALEGLRARAADPGAVLITGAVTLPDGRAAQWQEAAATEPLLARDWAESAGVFAALGNPVRLRLLRRVLDGACTAQQLTDIDGIGTTGQVYHHVRQLVSAGWLRSTGAGHYEVPVGRVVPLLTSIVGADR